MPELVGALMVHGQRVDMVRESEDRLLIPVCPPGVYLAEVRAAGVCVLYGHVEVLPSPLYEQDGVVCYTIDVDAMTDVLAVSLSMVEGIPGPRGEQGIQGERGLQGASAYDLAVAAGYEGSEAEWVAELQGAQAAANAARASEAAAAESARAAGADKTAAELARDDAQAAQEVAAAKAEKATEAAEAAQAPESLAVQAARPATMVLLRGELEALLGSSAAWRVDTDGQKIVVHTDRLADEQLAEVEDVLARFVPGFVELVQYNHDISIPWQEIPEGFTVVEWLESQEKERIVASGDFGTSEDILEADLLAPESKSSYKYPIILGCQLSEGYSSLQYHFQILETRYELESLYKKSGMSFQQESRLVDGTYVRPSDWSTSMYWVDSDAKFSVRVVNREFFLDGKSCGKVDAKYKHPISKITSLSLFYWWAETNVRIYNVKRISVETGEVLCNFIPCIDDTGAPCMVDRVTRTAYYNSGTGDFLYPGKEEEPATYSLRRPITYAQLTEHGVRRLYHVPKGYNGTVEEYAIEHGWLPLVETEPPEEGCWEPQWTATEDAIVLEWVEQDEYCGQHGSDPAPTAEGGEE